MHTVTVVPADKLIICDGVALFFDFQAPDGLHALQWRDDAGHTEWTGGPNRPLTVEDYDEQVAPYVALWRKEKTRREEMAAEEAAARALPDAKEAKIAEVLSGYDAALAASLTMPAAMPTSQDVAVGAALFAVDDAEGLAFIQERHAARRDELLAAVDAADSVEAVQSGMRAILRDCLIRNWGAPGRCDVRAFGAWAHHGGHIDAEACVFVQPRFWRGLKVMARDWLAHVGQAWNDEGLRGLLRPANWLPGVCRGLVATAGGRVQTRHCYATPWWIRLEERRGDMSRKDAAEMVRRLEAMRQDMERRL